MERSRARGRLRDTVLIVDDEPDVRRILRWILAPSVGVLEAATGEESVLIAARQAWFFST